MWDRFQGLGQRQVVRFVQTGRDHTECSTDGLRYWRLRGSLKLFRSCNYLIN